MVSELWQALKNFMKRLEAKLTKRVARLGTTGLPSEQVQLVENARQIARGDCEQAAEVLRRMLPGGTKRRFAGDRLLHEAYEHQGVVYDITANQYVRPDVWTQPELDRAGLAQAVESGVFSLQQHRKFMEKVLQVFGGDLD